ncbi:MAG TPA: hypothetical protein VHB54_14370 [Mucilaginibacter sp.]|nr:hypothetical protein [Mucilaginibacter sp.]
MKKLLLSLLLFALAKPLFAQSVLTLGRGLTGGSYNTTSNITTTIDTSKAYTWLKAQTYQVNSLGTTTTDGLKLLNTTSASSGAQQVSPSLHLGGQGWSTGSGGSSQPVDAYWQVTPLQGSPPSFLLQFLTSVNNSTPVSVFQISQFGAVLGGNFGSTAGLTGQGSLDGFYMTNATLATSSLNQYSRRVRWNGNGWNTSTLASNEADWISEMKTFSGNPITTRLAFSSQVNNGGYTERFGMADNGLFYFNSTAMTGNQLVGANSGATGMEAKTLSGSSGTGLTVSNGTGTITLSNDTTKLQTIANFFPKGDTRYAGLSTSNSFTTEQKIYRNSIGTTTTSGVSLLNTTAATSGNQQVSPSLHLGGQVWTTGAGGASQPVDAYWQVTPVQGTTGQFLLQLFTSINNATPSQVFQISQGGAVVGGTFNATAIGTGQTSLDGFFITNATAATSSLNQWSRRVRWNGNAWNTSTLASNSEDWITELKAFSGSPVTSRLAFSSQINGGGYAEKFGMADNGLFYLNGTALTGNQIVGANSGATGMEAKTLSGSSSTGLTITNGSGTMTFANDTTTLQTVADFFPKGDTRYLKTTTAAATYQPLLGYTAANDANVVHLTGNENISGTKTFAGAIAIGTTTVPTGYQFAINGNTIATSVTVQAETNWPDFVFGEQYRLMPLTELNTFIHNNHRLPGIPSAETVKKNGQDLGAMNEALLQKVEELTLYLVEKDKQIEDEKKRIDGLEKRLEKLEQLLKAGQ